MQEITVTPLEALHKLIGVASMIDTAECKDEAMYNALQGALVVAQTALAMAPKQEAVKEYLSTQTDYPTIKENLIVPFTEAMSALNHVRTVAPMSYGRDPRDVLCAFINLVAAPAAANGAMPELPPYIYGRETSPNEKVWTESAVRAILVASGPNAAPVKAKEEFIVVDWPACNPGYDYEDPYGGIHDHRSKGCTCEEAKESIARQRAALSGAKGD